VNVKKKKKKEYHTTVEDLDRLDHPNFEK